MDTIPNNWNNLDTRAHWRVNAQPDNFCAFVTFAPKETAHCVGGSWDLSQKQGLGSSSGWVQKFRR